MMHDSDPFNRWQAAQTYATNLMTAAAQSRLDLRPVTGTEAKRKAPPVRSALKEAWSEPAG